MAELIAMGKELFPSPPDPRQTPPLPTDNEANIPVENLKIIK